MPNLGLRSLRLLQPRLPGVFSSPPGRKAKHVRGPEGHDPTQ